MATFAVVFNHSRLRVSRVQVSMTLRSACTRSFGMADFARCFRFRACFDAERKTLFAAQFHARALLQVNMGADVLRQVVVRYPLVEIKRVSHN